MIVEIDRAHLAVMMEAGYIYIGMRRHGEARELFEGLSALVPESEVPLIALGNVDFCTGRLASAIRRYRKALAVDPGSVFAKVYLGEALFFSGEEEEGKRLLGEVAKKDRGGAGEFARALLDAIRKGHIRGGRKERA